MQAHYTRQSCPDTSLCVVCPLFMQKFAAKRHEEWQHLCVVYSFPHLWHLVGYCHKWKRFNGAFIANLFADYQTLLRRWRRPFLGTILTPVTLIHSPAGATCWVPLKLIENASHTHTHTAVCWQLWKTRRKSWKTKFCCLLKWKRAAHRHTRARNTLLLIIYNAAAAVVARVRVCQCVPGLTKSCRTPLFMCMIYREMTLIDSELMVWKRRRQKQKCCFNLKGKIWNFLKVKI